MVKGREESREREGEEKREKGKPRAHVDERMFDSRDQHLLHALSLTTERVHDVNGEFIHN